jgi:hypothetical protein
MKAGPSTSSGDSLAKSGGRIAFPIEGYTPRRRGDSARRVQWPQRCLMARTSRCRISWGLILHRISASEKPRVIKGPGAIHLTLNHASTRTTQLYDRQEFVLCVPAQQRCTHPVAQLLRRFGWWRGRRSMLRLHRGGGFLRGLTRREPRQLLGRQVLRLGCRERR